MSGNTQRKAGEMKDITTIEAAIESTQNMIDTLLEWGDSVDFQHTAQLQDLLNHFATCLEMQKED
jgi:hypothetical protein